MEQKQFDKNIKLIASSGAKLDTLLHECGVFALEQLNVHGNNGAANKLLGAFNRSGRKEAMLVWFNDFGMGRRQKDNTLNYSKDKKLEYDNQPITPEQAILIAESIPFYSYTKEIKPASSYDVFKALQHILLRAAKMKADGGEVEHGNPEVMAYLEKCPGFEAKV
jgi:hypothetical protein